MRKFMFFVLASVVLISFASRPVKVSFEETPDDIRLRGLLGLLDVSQVTATIHADSTDAKYYEIWMVNCRGDERKRRLMGFSFITPDSTNICFSAQPKDSSTLYLHIAPGVGPRYEVDVPTFNRLLVACDYDWEFNDRDTIPLMGYTTGIPGKVKAGNGEVFESWDICGIRYSKKNPSEWHRLYGIGDYLYFEAVPVKEMDFSKFE